MSFIKIVCPKCSAEAKLSLVDTSYIGPRRCWKCHEYFTITIENNRLTSCEPLSQEEYERQQAAKKAAEKAQGGINFSSRQSQMDFSQEPGSDAESSKEDTSIFDVLAGKSKGGIDISKRREPEAPREAPPKKQEFFRPPIPKEPPRQAEPKGLPTVFPPDRIQTFVPFEDTDKKPEKPKKPKEPKEPPDMFNPFIPPQT